jgi:ATP-dependent helicase/nuclease subunit B
MDCRGRLPDGVAGALEQGAIVVTSNQRAARAFRRGWDQRNRELGVTSWAPAAVMSWDAWLVSIWRGLVVEGHSSEMMLKRSQEQVVWRKILEADGELASLRAVDSLAAMAMEAWRLICRYEGQLRLQGAAGSLDTRSFERWANTFQRTCRSEKFFAQAQMEGKLREKLERSGSQPEFTSFIAGRVALVGFDHLSPAQSSLVNTLRATGVQVEELGLGDTAERRLLVEADDIQDELRTAARWVRQFLEDNSGATVGLIVASLEKERAEIDRVFREVLAPELEDIGAGNQTGPYEFSIGRALMTVPMIATAFDCLRWSINPLPLDRVSALLTSPYFAMSDEERTARAEFDAFELRASRMLRPEISLSGLVEMVERSRRKQKLPRLLRALRATQRVASRLQGLDARSHEEWAEKMLDLLGAASWGSGKLENSFEFQTRRKWESTLDELTALDFDGTAVEFSDALSALERIARETIFAPESRDAPVQVMGPLEAAGSMFDAIWFLRAGELSWPAASSSSSLLPWYLQRELEMPGTDVNVDSEHARKITERIAASANTIVFSYAKDSPDGKQRPSPVLAELSLERIATTDLVGGDLQRLSVELEEIADSTPVQPLPDRVVRGGARVLELQAACGFRAFAEKRLLATEIESVELGLDAAESGTVVHKALELFWNEVKTQETLRSMTATEREQVLNWCVDEALKKTTEGNSAEWDEAYLEVQRRRLNTVLSGWLDLESKRALPFEVKLSEKEFDEVRVGPLRLKVRVDRVDVVEGGEVLIDYKTGDYSPNDWLTTRPKAPQLPLYTILTQADQLRGVAFGLVRAGKDCALRGYEVVDGVLPQPASLKEAPTLQAQTERWSEVLGSLAKEFSSGEALVRPTKYPETCTHCGQRVLCRLDISLLEEDDDEEGPATEASGG